MIRVQIFKTLAGVQKRVRFENAHDKKHLYYAVPVPGMKSAWKIAKVKRV